jgi:biopolymer transport protein ExbD
MGQDIETEETAIDMTPMIDVTFQLLIFFMLTIKFKLLEGKLSAFLPTDVGVNSSDDPPKEKVDIMLQVAVEGSKLDPMKNVPWTGTGPFRYGPDRVIQYHVGPRKISDFEDLKRRLKEAYQQDPTRPVTIDSFTEVVYADVVRVLDAAIDADFRDITFKGAREPAKKKP